MAQPKRKRESSNDQAAKSYVLSYRDVAKLLSGQPLRQFFSALTREIEAAYRGPRLLSIERIGWPRNPDTLELMGCRSSDFTCVKLISSNPSSTDSTEPTVTGTMVCTEVGTDQARLVCDAAVLTPLRTAAATVVTIAKVKPNVKTLGIIGAGLEGTAHAVALSLLLPKIETVVFVDTVTQQTEKAINEVQHLLQREASDKRAFIDVIGLDESRLTDIYDCDAIITATYGQAPVVRDRKSKPLKNGTFIAAVGADLRGKRELDVTVYDSAKFIADDLGQCLREGELQHAAERHGVDKTYSDYKGRLLDGRIIGVGNLLDDAEAFLSRSEETVTVYDSTGFSGQDLALARVLLSMLEERKWPRVVWNPPEKVSLTEFLTQGSSQGNGRRLTKLESRKKRGRKAAQR
jgi:ornithine cyclodeaminase/alanine dehydrogenase-like protein (mu-crystallin family)